MAENFNENIDSLNKNESIDTYLDNSLNELLGEDIFDALIDQIINKQEFIKLSQNNDEFIYELEDNIEDGVMNPKVFLQIIDKYKKRESTVQKRESTVQKRESTVQKESLITKKLDIEKKKKDIKLLEVKKELKDNGLNIEEIKVKNNIENILVEENTEVVEKNTEVVEKNTEVVEENTEVVEKNTEVVEINTEVVESDIKKINNAAIENNDQEKTLGEILKLANEIRDELGDNFFSGPEKKEAEKYLEERGESKDSENYESLMNAYLIHKYSDRIILSNPKLEQKINDLLTSKLVNTKLGLKSKKVAYIDNLLVAGNEQIIYSDTFEGGTREKHGNTIIDGDQIYKIDKKTGKVDKYLFSEGSNYLMNVTIDFPTNYEYKKNVKETQKDVNKKSNEINTNQLNLNKTTDEKNEFITKLNILESSTENKNTDEYEIEKEMIEEQIKRLEREEQQLITKYDALVKEINILIKNANKVEEQEKNRISDFQEQQKEKDEKARETLKFLSSIGFDLIPQGITNHIIEMLNSNNGLRKTLGFDEEIDLVNGKLGINIGSDKENNSTEEKARFAEFTNIIISGEKGKPINVGNVRMGNSGFSDREKFKTQLVDSGINGMNGNIVGMRNIGDFVNNKTKESNVDK